MYNAELAALGDCEWLCRRLIDRLKENGENAEICFHGQLLAVYREVIVEAVKRLLKVEGRLSDMRRDVEFLSQTQQI